MFCPRYEASSTLDGSFQAMTGAEWAVLKVTQAGGVEAVCFFFFFLIIEK